MKISADFTELPADYTKHGSDDVMLGGVPIVSFPFYIDNMASHVKYLHWALTDIDAIPSCGFEWIHWTVANLPVESLMFDFNDSHALAIPRDFSRQMTARVPEALQGRNSSASRFVGRGDDPQVCQRYNGPQPPSGNHGYTLHVWGTAKPLEGLEQGFWLNELYHSFEQCGEMPDEGGIVLTCKA